MHNNYLNRFFPYSFAGNILIGILGVIFIIYVVPFIVVYFDVINRDLLCYSYYSCANTYRYFTNYDEVFIGLILLVIYLILILVGYYIRYVVSLTSGLDIGLTRYNSINDSLEFVLNKGHSFLLYSVQVLPIVQNKNTGKVYPAHAYGIDYLNSKKELIFDIESLPDTELVVIGYTLIYQDPLRLLRKVKNYYFDNSEKYYFNKAPILELRNFKLLNSMVEGELKLDPGAGSDLSFNLREYQKGDSLKLIHWKNSAKKGELLVKKRDDKYIDFEDLDIFITFGLLNKTDNIVDDGTLGEYRKIIIEVISKYSHKHSGNVTILDKDGKKTFRLDDPKLISHIKSAKFFKDNDVDYEDFKESGLFVTTSLSRLIKSDCLDEDKLLLVVKYRNNIKDDSAGFLTLKIKLFESNNGKTDKLSKHWYHSLSDRSEKGIQALLEDYSNKNIKAVDKLKNVIIL